MDPKDRLILALADEVRKMSLHLSKLAERTVAVTDDVSHLKTLGTSGTEYLGTGPSVEVLETFPNRFPDQEYEVCLVSDEFTSKCPKTGQPDFASLKVVYNPAERCVETKSLKLYLFRYRDEGAFMESIANQIMKDLVQVLEPKRLQVVMDFAPRGGIGLRVTADYDPNADKDLACTKEVVRILRQYQDPIPPAGV